MKKGFTLIELLAVIIILAIIALIVTPAVLGIISNSRKSASLRSGELYLNAVENEILNRNLMENFYPNVCEIQEDGNLLCDGENKLIIEASGRKPSKGTITLENGKVKSVTGMDMGDYEVETGENGSLIVKGESTGGSNPGGPGTGDSGGSGGDSGSSAESQKPSLSEELVPVKWDDDQNAWVITTEKDPDWYDYDKQEWANAVVLSDYGKLKHESDSLILPVTGSETVDVKAMFVWIPRYEYRIEGTYGIHTDGTYGTQKLPGEIKVNFIGTSKIEASEGYHIHPAFWWDVDSDGNREEGEELSGIWVGKFETSGSAGAPTILPNTKALVSQTVSEQFTTAQQLKVTGYDSHMAKNSEWGAVAYLSQSIYGKYGNTNYTGANKEVYINNSSGLYTGRSGGTPNVYSTSAGTCKYDVIDDRGSGTGQCGGGASTTGNITGVYDMSGGAWEYVMGNYNGSTGSSGFSNMPDLKYYDKYTSETPTQACSGGVCYGHALSETSGWYNDYAAFVSSSEPWFERGGINHDGASAGVFYFHVSSGGAIDNFSFRIVLVER